MNSLHNNAKLPLLTQLISGWHKDRNLIEGVAKPQVMKLLEEFTELVAAITPAETPTDVYAEVMAMLNQLHGTGRLKAVKDEDKHTAYCDAIGDMFVVMTNLTEKEGVTMEHCIELSWKEIKHRKGRMINGVFLKEADL